MNLQQLMYSTQLTELNDSLDLPNITTTKSVYYNSSTTTVDKDRFWKVFGGNIIINYEFKDDYLENRRLCIFTLFFVFSLLLYSCYSFSLIFSLSLSRVAHWSCFVAALSEVVHSLCLFLFSVPRNKPSSSQIYIKSKTLTLPCLILVPLPIWSHHQWLLYAAESHN